MQCDTVRKHTVTDSFRHILCVFGGLKLYTTSIKDFVQRQSNQKYCAIKQWDEKYNGHAMTGQMVFTVCYWERMLCKKVYKEIHMFKSQSSKRIYEEIQEIIANEDRQAFGHDP